MNQKLNFLGLTLIVLIFTFTISFLFRTFIKEYFNFEKKVSFTKIQKPEFTKKTKPILIYESIIEGNLILGKIERENIPTSKKQILPFHKILINNKILIVSKRENLFSKLITFTTNIKNKKIIKILSREDSERIRSVRTKSCIDIPKNPEDMNIKFGPNIINGKITGYKIYELSKGNILYKLGARNR